MTTSKYKSLLVGMLGDQELSYGAKGLLVEMLASSDKTVVAASIVLEKDDALEPVLKPLLNALVLRGYAKRVPNTATWLFCDDPEYLKIYPEDKG